MKSLAELITDLENAMPYMMQSDPSVSQVSIGWHIEHSLLAMIKMISATEHSNPADFKKKFNFKRSLVLTMGKIPRGKAKVPDSVKPGEEITEATIRPLLDKAKQKVDLFEQLNSNKYFTHPVFGDVKVKQARKIIAIHTQHHLNIINDIRRSQ